MQKEEYSVVNDSYSEQSDVEYNYRFEAKKVKRRVVRCYQKPAKLDHTGEMDDAYNTYCYNGNSSKSKKIKEGRTQSSKTRKKSCRKEIDKDLYNREKKVLSYCNAIFWQITKRREETPGTDDANYKICSNRQNKIRTEWEEYEAFRHFEKLEETKNKNKVMPEESLCGNSNGKVLIVEERFLDVDNSIANELGKDRKKVEKKTKSNLKVQVELKSCYLKKSGLKRNSNEEKKVETIPLEPKKIMNGKTQKDNYSRMLMGDEKGSVKEQHNGIEESENNESASIDNSDEIIEGKEDNSEKEKELPKRGLTETKCLKSVKSSNRGIGTEDVKKKKDKGIKIRMELSMTYLKPAKMIYTKKIRDLEDYEHEFEKVLPDQDELLEVEVKDAKALVCQGFKQKGLASENQRVTYLEHEQDRLKPANYDKSMKVLEGLEAVHQFNNNHIRLEDQFQQSRVQSVHIDVENNRSNGKLLVSKMNNEKEDRKMDDLPELDREVIQNIKWDKNSEVVMPEIGIDTADIDNEIIDHLFNPEYEAFRHFEKLEETKNKVNIPEVYQKNKVMPEESLCGNSDGKVLIVEERFLDIDNSIANELGKDRKKVEEKTKSDLKAQVELKSCYLKKSGLKRNSNKEKKVETIPLGPKKIMNGKTQKDNYSRMLTGDEKGSVKEQHNSIEESENNESASIDNSDEIIEGKEDNSESNKKNNYQEEAESC
ncbi:35343_t:CDS:10 [Gigaspora margarita]|uniref:35343_t:CDS:1 n=1 Tax=Gigaspora margarita TaxID=4874 RepID=A0ABM8VYP0_GIGMA|nr:35343_t:CDS:10 [Gigaspora margarita]